MYRKVLVFLLTVLVVIAIAGCWICKNSMMFRHQQLSFLRLSPLVIILMAHFYTGYSPYVRSVKLNAPGT